MTDLMETLVNLKALMDTAEVDIEKFDEGNRAAGVRVRKGMQNIKKVAQKIREIVQQGTRRSR